MMQLRDALRDFSVKRITRLTIREASAVQGVCAKFKAAKKSNDEDTQKRIERILDVSRNDGAIYLTRRDIRFIATAIGSKGVTAPRDIDLILHEVKRRNDGRLFDAIFTALLANFRHSELRKVI